MILESPDGQVLNFWSHRHAPKTPKKLVVRTSGGTDSTALLALLCHTFKDIEVQPILLEEKALIPYQDIVESILDKIRKMYPSANIRPLDVSYVVNKPDFDWITYCNEKQIPVIVQGRTCAPPLGSLEEDYPTSHLRQPDNDKWQSCEMDFYNGAIKRYNPLLYVNKRFIRFLFDTLKLQDVFPLTSSCTRNFAPTDPRYNNRPVGPCKECFQCAEKKWAFGVFDHEQYN